MNIDELAEQVAQKLDIEGRIRQTLSFLPPEDIAALAEQTSPYMWADIPTNALRKIKRAAPTRFTIAGADINFDSNGAGVGHSGPTLPDIVDFVSGTGYLTTGDGRELHLNVGGGGADCMFDYLISTCWATLVAAGRGTEGQVMTSLTGCTFKVYSTIDAAFTHAETLGASTNRVFFICGGVYTEQTTPSPPTGANWDVYGAGSSSCIMRVSGNSQTLMSLGTLSSGSRFRLRGIHFDLSTGNRSSCTGFAGGSNFAGSITDFFVSTGDSTNLGINISNQVSGSISYGGFSGSGTGITPGGSVVGQNLTINNNDFACGTGITTAGNRNRITSNFFNCSTMDMTIQGNTFEIQVVGNTFNKGISTTSAEQRNVLITGNEFRLGNGEIGIDFSSVSVNSEGYTVTSNTFAGSGTAIGIKLDANMTQGVIALNTFTGFTATNEITAAGGANLQIFHNESDAGALDDAGPVVGHTGLPTGTDAVAAHNILDGGTAHLDAASDSVTRGSLIVGNSTPAWDELVLGASGTILRSDGTDAAWASLATAGIAPTPHGLVSSHHDNEADFTATLGLAVVQVGDANFQALISSSNPRIEFDTSADRFVYDRSNNRWSWVIGNTEIMRFTSTGNVVLGYERVGSLTAPTNTTAGDLTATRLIVPNATILHSAITQLGGPVVIPGDGALLFSDNTNYVGIKSPATPQSENYIYELPDDDPADGQVLAVKSIAGSPTISTEWVDQSAGGGGETRVVLSAGQGRPATTSGCGGPVQVEFGTNDIDVVCLDFDATNTEYAIWERDLPAWDQGTVTYHVHWFTSSSTNTHTASFWLQGLAHGDSETLDAAYGTAIEVTDNATSTANQHLKTAESAALTVGGTPADHDELITWRLSRVPGDGDDDLNVDARVLKVCITYTS